jgi:hypothetical protein
MTIADEIRSYVRQHPRAEDTIEGIGARWLTKASVKSLALEQALNELVEERLLAVYKGPDGRQYYRVNRDRRSDDRERPGRKG